MKRLLLSFLPCLLSAQVVPGPAHIQVFQTTAKTVRRGDTVTLRWSATGADRVRLEPLGLILPAKGEITHMVTGRIVYWLHVTNVAGGQSVPLVVDLLPEEPAPAVPAGPLPVSPAVSPELPRLADLPPVPSPKAALPAAAPTPPARRIARRHGPRRVWIQFAATVSSKGAARLQRKLQRVAATESTLLVRHRRSGRTLQLIRNGPFPSVQAARVRLQELAPALQALKIKPVILVGPPQPMALASTYIADFRQPG